MKRTAFAAALALLGLNLSAIQPADAGVVSFYRWKDTGGITCSSGNGGEVITGTRVFEYGNLPDDAQLLRESRVSGLPDFNFGPYDAPDGSDEESFSSFGDAGLGPYPFVWEDQYVTLVDGEPVYQSTAVAACYGDGPAVETIANTPLVGEFGINDGMTASWFDIFFNGQGFNIEILSAPTVAGKGALPAPGSAVVYWYSFDAMGFPFWMFGVGFWSGNTLTVPLLFDYDGSGPFFGPGWNTAQFVPTNFGVLTFIFLTCTQAYATFAAGDGATYPSHEFFLNRITNVRGITDCLL